MFTVHISCVHTCACIYRCGALQEPLLHGVPPELELGTKTEEENWNSRGRNLYIIMMYSVGVAF